MSKKGTRLSEETKAAISRGNKKHPSLEITLRDDRLYLRAKGNQSVSLEIDVTPVWHFFKEATGYTTTTSTPNE